MKNESFQRYRQRTLLQVFCFAQGEAQSTNHACTPALSSTPAAGRQHPQHPSVCRWLTTDTIASYWMHARKAIRVRSAPSSKVADVMLSRNGYTVPYQFVGTHGGIEHRELKGYVMFQCLGCVLVRIAG
jgi:hypothetical protein